MKEAAKNREEVRVNEDGSVKKPVIQEEDDDLTLCEMIYRHKWMVVILCFGVLLGGCGRKWEQFWGQDTRPEVRYIPMTANQVEIPIGVINPVTYPLTQAMRNSKWLDVWACTPTDTCVEIPEDRPEGDEMTVYVTTGDFLQVYNSTVTYPSATKIRVQFVVQ